MNNSLKKSDTDFSKPNNDEMLQRTKDKDVFNQCMTLLDDMMDRAPNIELYQLFAKSK